jgi:hypothetical protein
MYHGLRTDGRKIGLLAIVSAYFDEGKVGVSGSDGFEGEGAEAPLPGDAGAVGRTLGGDGDNTVAVVAVGDGDELVIAAEEFTRVDVDELEDGWVELYLERYGEDVVCIGYHDGDLEGTADALVGAGRNNAEVDRLTTGVG